MEKRGRFKRGISGVIVWIIGIGLVLVAVGIIWAVASNFINQNVDRFGSCSDVIGKVELNRDFTCRPTNPKWAVVSVSVGDIQLDGLKFVINTDVGQPKIYEIDEDDDGKARAGIGMFGADLDAGDEPFSTPKNPIRFPDRGDGFTYIFDASDKGNVREIRLIPIVDGEECSAVDVADLDPCSRKVLDGAGGIFDLGCEITTPISANTVQKNAPIRFSHSGNPTHFRVVVSQFTGDNKEIELCRVGPQFDGSVTEEAITSNPQEYICNWKDNGDSDNSEILDSAWNSDDDLVTGDYNVEVFVYHKESGDDEDDLSFVCCQESNAINIEENEIGA